MRYVLYLFTLGLVFTAGMMVGNFYLPAHNASVAAAVSVPDMDRVNPAIDEANAQQTQFNLNALTQALSSCSVVVETERKRLFNQIMLFLSVQDFELKKAVYEAEIAKNAVGSPTTSQFSRAAQEYTSAKQKAEQLADQLFPPEVTPEPPAQTPEEPAQTPEEPVQTPEEPATAQTVQISTPTATASVQPAPAQTEKPGDKKAPAQQAEAVVKNK